jgi:hypothetical protein
VGSGKTLFLERLIAAKLGVALGVRSTRGRAGAHVRQELTRYRLAGAQTAAGYEFDQVNTDEFFTTDVMENYSQVVFIEGDRPVDFVDLTVFVAPVSLEAPTMLRRELRAAGAARAAALDDVLRHLGGVEGVARLFGTRERLLGNLNPAGLPPEHWTLGPSYQGIQHAQLVVLNVRSEDEREAAASLVTEVARLRKDPAVFRDVFGPRGSKLPVTALIADLSNPKDPGIKKAIARVKRAMPKR